MRRYDWSAGYCMIYACVQGSWRSLILDLKRIRKQVEKSAMNLAGIPILRTLIITRPQKIALKQADTGAGRVNDDVRERQFPNALLKRITAGKPKIFLYILLLDILVYAC